MRATGKRLHRLRIAILAAFSTSCIENKVRQDPAEHGDAVVEGAVVDTGVPKGPRYRGTAPGCEDARERVFNGHWTGTVLCADGTIDRVEHVECNPSAEAPGDCGSADDCGRAGYKCDQKPYGRCMHGDDGCYCDYGCATDADCPLDMACVCADDRMAHGTCAFVDCRTGADCASGRCRQTYARVCTTYPIAGCREGPDDCVEDCDGRLVCQPSTPGEPWACNSNGACGRPMQVAGAPVVAPTQARSDWTGEAISKLAHDPARGAWWAEIGALEHGSVAGFARLTLQLSALGAPPELLAEALRAGADEVRHAALAYGVASQLLDQPVGPGALPVSDAPLEFDPESVLREVIYEACVGETLGVAEAWAHAAAATEPCLAEVWTTIASDEQRHAALAWRIVGWLLEQHPRLKPAAREAFSVALAVFTRPVDSAADRLSVRTVNQVRAEAIAQVVVPCAATLLG